MRKHPEQPNAQGVERNAHGNVNDSDERITYI